MAWFGIFGGNRQVKDCLAALDTFDSDFREELAWQFLKPAVAGAIRKHAETVRLKVLRENVPPRDIVLTLAANIALAALGSGEHHTYRGRLSMVGSSYRVIFSSIVTLQKMLGTISEEERDQALINMAEAIAEAG